MTRMDYRKGIIALVIGVLIVFFTQATIEAFAQSPSYNDFCDVTPPSRFSDLSDLEQQQEYERFEEEQRACMEEFNEARENHDNIVFVFSLLGAAISIVLALYLPLKGGGGITISSGLLLGGFFNIFIGTIRGWSSLTVEFRPIILLLELILVIVVSYKNLK